MKKLKQSRQSELNIETIRAQRNIYDTILIASQRAYELRKGAMPKINDNEDPYNSGCMTALLEIQEGK